MLFCQEGSPSFTGSEEGSFPPGFVADYEAHGADGRVCTKNIPRAGGRSVSRRSRDLQGALSRCLLCLHTDAQTHRRTDGQALPCS